MCSQVARELLLERQPERRGHVPLIEPAVLPADSDVSGVWANQGLSDRGARLDEADREGPGAKRHDAGSIQQSAEKYKTLPSQAGPAGQCQRLGDMVLDQRAVVVRCCSHGGERLQLLYQHR